MVVGVVVLLVCSMVRPSVEITTARKGKKQRSDRQIVSEIKQGWVSTHHRLAGTQPVCAWGRTTTRLYVLHVNMSINWG
jgi:hypothetical protein